MGVGRKFRKHLFQHTQLVSVFLLVSLSHSVGFVHECEHKGGYRLWKLPLLSLHFSRSASLLRVRHHHCCKMQLQRDCSRWWWGVRVSFSLPFLSCKRQRKFILFCLSISLVLAVIALQSGCHFRRVVVRLFLSFSPCAIASLSLCCDDWREARNDVCVDRVVLRVRTRETELYVSRWVILHGEPRAHLLEG